MKNAVAYRHGQSLDGLDEAQLAAMKDELLKQIEHDVALAPELVGHVARLNAYLRAARRAQRAGVFGNRSRSSGFASRAS
jgi:hypothetical protein